MTKGRLFVIAAAGAVLVAVGFVAWFFSREGPAEADLEATAEAVTGNTDEESGTLAGLDGTWSVDGTIGAFSIDDPTSSFVGFRVNEELSGLGAVTAVGRTPAISGSSTVEGTTLTAAEFTVDLTTIVSNDSRRDDNIQDALNTVEFPSATLVLADPVDFGDGLLAGDVVAVDIAGDLTVHGVTNSVTMPVEAQLVNGSVLVVGSMDIVFADYGVSVPSARIVVSAEDHGILEVQIWLSQGALSAASDLSDPAETDDAEGGGGY